MILKRFIILTMLVAAICSSVAAQDSTATKPIPRKADPVTIETEDTVAIQSYAARFNPRKALLYAAVVPGLGQVYNKKYWKLPLVYGGFVAIGFNIKNFNDAYVDYRGLLFDNLEAGLADSKNPGPSGFTTPQLRRVVDRARRERDFWIIMMGAMYLLQMVDAHVDAHLKEFDLNPNLQVSLEPLIERDQVLGNQTGASLVIRF